ncbi:rCG22880, isoform CRA_c [Rattus norvegicus]|uniref:RCG22880, isoform CRA_c n=1 Tax=Rattus norvegicus TaxID=10116 RepID=A6KP69_RAT|nr:rCG22880, isoform CRA_c [Rattus norvegicus]
MSCLTCLGQFIPAILLTGQKPRSSSVTTNDYSWGSISYCMRPSLLHHHPGS